MFATVGGITGDAAGERTLRSIGKERPDFFLPLGEGRGPAGWCELLARGVGTKVPVRSVAGPGGTGTGAGCPSDDRGSQGTYPVQYYFDHGPLLRTVVLSPGLDIAGHRYVYGGGSEDERWLRSVLDDARRLRITWVVVAMSSVCLSIGPSPCEMGPLLNLLVDYRVDLVLQGQDRSYQRSAQVALSPLCRQLPTTGDFNADCVVDDGRDGAYRAGGGTIAIVVGSGTSALDNLNDGDEHARYVVAVMGAGRQPTSGYLKVTVDGQVLKGQFVKSSGPADFGDRFEVTR